MKLLSTDQRVLTWICVFPVNKTTSKCRKLTYITLALAITLIMLTAFMSSLKYSLNFMSFNLQETLVGLRPFLVSVQALNSIVVTFFLRHKIPPIYEQLREIYEKCLYKFKIFRSSYIL